MWTDLRAHEGRRPAPQVERGFSPVSPLVEQSFSPAWEPVKLMPALLVLLISIIHGPSARAQATGDPKPELRAGALTGDIRIDGRLDEAAWVQADAITSLTMTEPHEGATPSMTRRVGRARRRVRAARTRSGCSAVAHGGYSALRPDSFAIGGSDA